jgi:hypothetical protein
MPHLRCLHFILRRYKYKTAARIRFASKWKKSGILNAKPESSKHYFVERCALPLKSVSHWTGNEERREGERERGGDFLPAVIVPSFKYNFRTNEALNEFNKEVKKVKQYFNFNF